VLRKKRLSEVGRTKSRTTSKVRKSAVKQLIKCTKAKSEELKVSVPETNMSSLRRPHQLSQ